jgi:hypothetical protein
VLERKGHGEYRDVSFYLISGKAYISVIFLIGDCADQISEAEFLTEVTGSKKVIAHFFHKEFMRCK